MNAVQKRNISKHDPEITICWYSKAQNVAEGYHLEKGGKSDTPKALISSPSTRILVMKEASNLVWPK